MRGQGLVIVDWIAGKNARLRCATTEFTSLRLEHESFAVSCSFALLGSAFHPILVHRLAASLHASSPRSVALSQLRFASFVVINLREDLHLQECAHAGRTMKKGGLSRPMEPWQATLGSRHRLRDAPTRARRLRLGRRRSGHRLPPFARRPIPRPPAARWRDVRSRPSLPSPCEPGGRPCRCRRGSGDRR